MISIDMDPIPLEKGSLFKLQSNTIYVNSSIDLIKGELCHGKTCLPSCRSGLTHIRLNNYRRWLEHRTLMFSV